MTEEKAHYWNRVAKAWQEAPPKTLWRAYNDAVNASLFACWLPPGGIETLLKTDLFDESLGDGLYPLLASRAKNVVGMDISILTSHSARSRRGGLQAVNADVRHLPFVNGAFDVIVSNSTLDHFESSDDIVASLRELNRVLRAGGQLFLTLDNLANPIIALRNTLPFRLLNHLNIVPYYVGTTFGPSCLCRHLNQVGLEVLEVSAVMHFPRMFTMAIAHILERHTRPKIQRHFLHFLMSFEHLSCWPTRFLTGYFVAVRAIKR
ncbi:MAG: class I SAM-dependent methyltransferase [Ignavibacteriales bacterium]